MKKKIISFITLISILGVFMACAKPFMENDGLYATFNTNIGEFTASIFFEEVPVTAGNFIGLSEGVIEYTDPSTNQKAKKPFYNGIIFHRIIKDFMIQGGDPLGKGYGGPGYSFFDEIVPELTHSKEGILSMANSGPDTNGSQFFITLGPTPHLNGKHTVFGEIVDGMDVVKTIGSTKTDQNDKPYKDVFIKSIKITRVGEAAKAFDALQAFESKDEIIKEREAQKDVVMKEFLDTLGCNEANKHTMENGLIYYTTKQGSGAAAQTKQKITAHYSGYLYNGQKFDSSYDRNQPFDVVLGAGQVIKGWDEGLVGMKVGEKRILVIPYYLGYGERGYPGVIPPKATLIFETELLGVQ